MGDRPGDAECQARRGIQGLDDHPVPALGPLGNRPAFGLPHADPRKQLPVLRVLHDQLAPAVAREGQLAAIAGRPGQHLTQDLGRRHHRLELAHDLVAATHRAGELGAQKPLHLFAPGSYRLELGGREQLAALDRLLHDALQVLLGNARLVELSHAALESLQGPRERQRRVDEERLAWLARILRRGSGGRELEPVHQLGHLPHACHELDIDPSRIVTAAAPQQRAHRQARQLLEATSDIVPNALQPPPHLFGHCGRLGGHRPAERPLGCKVREQHDTRQRQHGQQQKGDHELSADPHVSINAGGRTGGDGPIVASSRSPLRLDLRTPAW